MSAMSFGALVLPKTFLAGRSIDPMEALYEGMDVAAKKQLADIALNVARSKGASYADIRIGRYLNQFVATRENKLQAVANTESFGAGVRVIANGCWGFAASDDMTKDGIARVTERAVNVAKANAKIQGDSVKLAPQKGFGEAAGSDRKECV
jgi:TldD protein